MPHGSTTQAFEARTLQTAVAQVGAAVVVTDLEGIIEYVNPAFLEMSGYRPEEVVGHSTRLLKSGAHSRTVYEQLWSTVRAGKRWEGELINRAKDGSLYHVSSSIAPVLDESGKARRFIQVCVDITEKTKLHEMMRQRDKLESLGALASGIAHDFRNVLSAIVNQADLARTLLGRAEPTHGHAGVKDSLDLILSTAHHAGELVQRLLDFSAPSRSLTPTPVSLQHEIHTVTRILGSSVPGEVKILTHWEDIDQWVNAYPFAIQQVLLNLGLNAADAIGTRQGFIRLEASPVELAEGRHGGGANGLAPGRYINLRVVDNGPGIPEAVRDKIFEPFFSTKARRDRNGLGLAMVARLVDEMQGHITFESALGVGTRFEVLLPLVEPPAEPLGTIRILADGASPVRPEESGGEKSASLLFLEDDPTISKGARIILESCGFSVEHYARGQDALKAMAERRRPFDLVLCDYHLSDMNAGELIRRALEVSTPQRFVLVSGSLLDGVELGSLNAHVSRVFKKPISYFTVARELHELLGTAAAGEPPGK
jgi:PAS domain S-box-containing protein